MNKWDVARQIVSRSAVCQARRKISHGVFIALRDIVCRFINEHASLKEYRGYRVLAIDGSTIRVPDLPQMRDFFGKVRGPEGFRAIARASLVYDVLNHFTYDAILGKYRTSEHDLAWEYLDDAALPDRCLFMLDRGYVSFPLLKQIQELGHAFCARVTPRLNVVKELNATGGSEGFFYFKPSSKAKAGIPRGSSFRQPIRVRVIKIKQNGSLTYLMTSLVEEKTSLALEFNELYHKRWQIEEAYKAMKCRLMIEEFSGTTPEIVCQDFHAKIFSACLTEALALEVVEGIEEHSLTTMHDYKLCFAQAFAKMKNALPLLFLRKCPRKLLKDIFEILMRSLVAVVPGRKFKRKNHGKCAPKLNLARRAYRQNR